MYKRWSVLFAFCLLAGCGFKLRGLTEFPAWLNNVAIVIQNANRDLEPKLKAQLQAYNISIAESAASASYLLIIESDSYQQQITGVGASTTPRQYQLLYSVRFHLIDKKGKVIVPNSQIVVTRQLTVNNDRILGSDSEQTTLSNEMRNDAALQIINRLSKKL